MEDEAKVWYWLKCSILIYNRENVLSIRMQCVHCPPNSKTLTKHKGMALIVKLAISLTAT